jgi:uncharacterized protein YchJ
MRSQEPDELVRFGTLELARFGKVVQMRNLATKEEHDAHIARMAEHLDQVVAEINTCVAKVAEIVSRCSPLALLKRAWWENARLMTRIETEAEVGHEEALALRMVDYVQAVIVSHPRDGDRRDEPTEEDWASLRSAVEKLFMAVSLPFHAARRAKKKVAGEAVNDTLEDFYFEAQNYWCNIRGKRYVAHNVPYFRTLVEPHDAVLRDAFGVSSADLLRLIEDVVGRHTKGLGETVRELREIQVAVVDEAARTTPPDGDEEAFALAARAAMDRLGSRARFEELMERMFGEGLFELKPENGISDEFLNALSLSPGEDTAFFAEGEFKGWPLRVWPNWRKPLLRIDGKHLCMDYYGLMDNLYRVLERLVVGARPTYKEEWNKRRKVVTERWPLDLLARILPGATIRQSVFYPHPDPAKSRQWCELDGLLTYDDVLFIVEVKGGTFSREPPTTDFDAYIRSLRDLIESPSNQAGRFLQYLESAREVPVYDDQHREVARLRRDEFGLVVPTAVTLDNLSELAARSKHLAGLGIDAGPRPVWTVSIEDLMVYADIFRRPLDFLYFIELRLAAFASAAVNLNDELDHAGLFFRHNNYVQRVEEMRTDSKTKVSWTGYRAAIDQYFHDVQVEEEPPTPPEQRMPALLREVLDVLARQGRPGRRRLASYLLADGGDRRDALWERVRESMDLQRETHRPRPVTVHGETNVTVFCWEPAVVARDEKSARHHALSAMAAAGKQATVLLELTVDNEGRVHDASGAFLAMDSLPPDERARAGEAGRVLAARRVQTASGDGSSKIGRNDTCPCGSGKKYKRCHGAP